MTQKQNLLAEQDNACYLVVTGATEHHCECKSTVVCGLTLYQEAALVCVLSFQPEREGDADGTQGGRSSPGILVSSSQFQIAGGLDLVGVFKLS